MREIKFRGIRADKTDSDFVYGGYYSFNNNHYIVQKDIWDETLCTACLIEISEDSRGMFTGHKDKNSEACYSGDEIKFEGNVYTILWDDDLACFTYEDTTWSKNQHSWQFTGDIACDCEIIAKEKRVK